MYKKVLRPVLFLFSPEVIHNFIIGVLRLVSKLPFSNILIKFIFPVSTKEVKLWNLVFKHPVGLAAGLDKNAEAYEVFGSMGFSFVEIGTLTPKEQLGNPKPRIFRLPNDSALINRMGFNNRGVESAIKNLKKRSLANVIIGGNIGKNKLTPNEKALDDYVFGLREISPYVDYIVINISSPNTPNLRELQKKEQLEKLLLGLSVEKQRLKIEKPLLVKIAPDMTFEQIDKIIELVLKYNIDGIVATNTTIERDNLSYEENYVNNIGAGGLSGSPLNNRSTQIIAYISEKTKGKLPIIGVGGILTARDAIEKLQAGASLVQLYTGFIYEGPGLIKRVVNSIT